MYSYEESFLSISTPALKDLDSIGRRNRIPHSQERQLGACRVPPTILRSPAAWQNNLKSHNFANLKV